MALPALKPAGTIAASGRLRKITLTFGSGIVEPLPGHKVRTPTVNGTTPGPVLHFNEGDDVRVLVINHLVQPTSVHWHGIPVSFAHDGAAVMDRSAIQPGAQYEYRFLAPQAGTYMYHAHYHEMEQDSIVGMIVVHPQDDSREPHYDVDVPLVVTSLPWEPNRRPEAQAVLANSMFMFDMAATPGADPKPGMGDPMERMDMVEYWGLNGKTFPATQPIMVKTGDRVRVRFANITNMTHPMHLHGHWFRWIAVDGVPIAQPQAMNTVPVDPGRTIDIDFIANNPGVWPLHCHIVSHMVDNHDLMAGIVTVVQYQGYQLPMVMQALLPEHLD